MQTFTTNTELKEGCKKTFEYISDRFWNLYTPDREIVKDAYRRIKNSGTLGSLTRNDKKEIIQHTLEYRATQRQFLRKFNL